jgi:ribosomal protein S18 acetylase RimI-like enzyme
MAEFAAYEPSSARRPILGLSIREATAEDVPALAEISARREGGEIGEHARALHRWVAEGSSGGSLLLVACHAGRAIGFGKCRRFEPAPDAPGDTAPAGWYLAGVIVDPSRRRQGVGEALTHARLDWIRARSDRAYYFANARNAASIVLHAKLGFREISRTFHHPEARFAGGSGVLFETVLGG